MSINSYIPFLECSKISMSENSRSFIGILPFLQYAAWSLTFATQMLFRRSGSERFDTFMNITLLRIFPSSSSSSIFHGVGPLVDPFRSHVSTSLFKGSTIKYLPLAARYNLCQGPVPGRGPAVEKHCSTATLEQDSHNVERTDQRPKQDRN
jgi:hypothetical protein